jgi:hemerythrin-like domain-containing protein
VSISSSPASYPDAADQIATGEIRAEHGRLARVLTLISRCRWDGIKELELRLPLLIEALEYIVGQHGLNHIKAEEKVLKHIADHDPLQRKRVSQLRRTHLELQARSRRLLTTLKRAANLSLSVSAQRRLALGLDRFATTWRLHIEAEESLLYSLASSSETEHLVLASGVDKIAALRESHPLLAQFFVTGEQYIFVRHGAEAKSRQVLSAGAFWWMVWHDSVGMAQRCLTLGVPRYPKLWLRDLGVIASENANTVAVWFESATMRISCFNNKPD